MPNITKMGS
uniref:Uncharacterized protein n=1 Tax=Arundo donax TaxID=35708 RepID=A0A0A8Y6L3_ARUDO